MKFSESGDALHCLFSGRLDGLVCSEIERELLARVAAFKDDRDDVRLVFDLAGVVFISSAFLRLCLIQCKAFGKSHFSITNVSDEIHKVFRISGFSEIMEIVPVDEAAA